eukprot:CAMPEP_0176364436 /NCGR_PEP_ID=MMETSP0126-20121128/19790_1 /TAXON_ID=141414 ORGANISM="Strombidinopsis acuminatum, Strain SPMC142" /NCGR_SAMPLE_ID=MMETSP0126 /ASSEMBLY_ACC=CAM_ASM_000229 /LENGTH=44 /DNA_ID= /DNA_START= /DNA_END= /DNA_ORIENTATION=
MVKRLLLNLIMEQSARAAKSFTTAYQKIINQTGGAASTAGSGSN